MRWRTTILPGLCLLLALLTACGGSSALAPANSPLTERDREVARPIDSKPAEAAKPADGAKTGSNSGVRSHERAPASVGEAPAKPGTASETAPRPAAASEAAGPAASASRPAEVERRPEPAPGQPTAPVPPVDGGSACRGCPVPPRTTPLRAGQVDDNQAFDEYLRYLKSYRGPAAWTVDVSQRHLISVLDEQQRPVANATVRIYNRQQRLIFEGRTYATGQTLFHPRAQSERDQSDQYHVIVEKQGRLATQSFYAQDGEQWSVTLAGPALRSLPIRLDLLFLIDSTGSMGGEISKIQSTLSTIVGRIGESSPGQPIIRYAGVTYRDRGDSYVVKKFGFTEDQQAFQGWLNTLRAGGGGDYPESLNQALHTAIGEMDWDQGEALRLVFLVADAPPHLDYPNDYRYTTEASQAVRKGIKIYSIGASGLSPLGEYVFRQLAQQTLAQYIFITRGGDQHSGGGPVSATNIQSAENNLDDIIVRIVRQELLHLN